MKKDKETSYYKFDTTSKYDGIRACDCVVRAISLALDKTWEEVYTDLCKLGLEEYRMPNEKYVYAKYLKSLGYEMQKTLWHENDTKYKAREFAEEFSGTYILHTAGHLTCIKDGKIHDTWNCGDYSVGNYWKIK